MEKNQTNVPSGANPGPPDDGEDSGSGDGAVVVAVPLAILGLCLCAAAALALYRWQWRKGKDKVLRRHTEGRTNATRPEHGAGEAHVVNQAYQGPPDGRDARQPSGGPRPGGPATASVYVDVPLTTPDLHGGGRAAAGVYADMPLTQATPDSRGGAAPTRVGTEAALSSDNGSRPLPGIGYASDPHGNGFATNADYETPIDDDDQVHYATPGEAGSEAHGGAGATQPRRNRRNGPAPGTRQRSVAQPMSAGGGADCETEVERGDDGERRHEEISGGSIARARVVRAGDTRAQGHSRGGGAASARSQPVYATPYDGDAPDYNAVQSGNAGGAGATAEYSSLDVDTCAQQPLRGAAAAATRPRLSSRVSQNAPCPAPMAKDHVPGPALRLAADTCCSRCLVWASAAVPSPAAVCCTPPYRMIAPT